MTHRENLGQLIEKMQANPEAIQSLHHVYQFHVDEEPPFQVRFDNGTVEILEGTPQDAHCTVTLSTDSFNKLLRNDLNTTMAFMMGKLKVEGRMGLALKLQEVLKEYA